MTAIMSSHTLYENMEEQMRDPNNPKQAMPDPASFPIAPPNDPNVMVKEIRKLASGLQGRYPNEPDIERIKMLAWELMKSNLRAIS